MQLYLLTIGESREGTFSPSDEIAPTLFIYYLYLLLISSFYPFFPIPLETPEYR